MYLARHLTDNSVTDIGKSLGNRDHSTVIHGYDKISKDMKRIHPYITQLMCLLKN